MIERLWRQLGLKDKVRLELNSLGDREDRARYRELLVEFLSARRDELDADSQRRLETNPLRLFDSKNENTRQIMADAPRLSDHLGEPAREHFQQLTRLLDALGIDYVINPGLVRGLDYYCRTVFEWVTDQLGAQGTVCAGGRYDELVAIQGGKPTPGIGLAMGVERLLALLEADGLEKTQAPTVYIVSQIAAAAAMTVAEDLRTALPGVGITMDLLGGSFKSQFKRADRSGASWAVVLGESEWQADQVQLKPLRGEQPQQLIPRAELASVLSQQIGQSSRQEQI